MNTDEVTNQINNEPDGLIESYVKMSALDKASYYYCSNYDVIARYACDDQKRMIMQSDMFMPEYIVREMLIPGQQPIPFMSIKIIEDRVSEP